MTLEQMQALVNRHISKVLELCKSGQIKWEPAEVPKPNAMRAFMGLGGGYMIHVIQANVEGQGVIHMGTITYAEEMTVVKLPPPIDSEVYHLAAASQN